MRKVITIDGVPLLALEAIGVDKTLIKNWDLDYIENLKRGLQSSNQAFVNQCKEALTFLNAYAEASLRANMKPLAALRPKETVSLRHKIYVDRRFSQKDFVSNYNLLQVKDVEVDTLPTENTSETPDFQEYRFQLAMLIRLARYESGLSARQLESKSGISDTKILRLESGKPVANLEETLRILEVALNLKIIP